MRRFPLAVVAALFSPAVSLPVGVLLRLWAADTGVGGSCNGVVGVK